MAGSFSNYLELKLLDLVFSNTAYTIPTNVYIGLFTVTPSDTGGGTEVSGGAYARATVTNNSTNWPAASAGAKTTGAAIPFVQASANWGTVVAFGIFDALTVGNLLAWGDVTPNKAINSGDTASFAIGDIDITLD